MRVRLSLITAVIALLWAVVTQFFPDLPIDQATFSAAVLAIVLSLLAALGVEVVEGFKPNWFR